MSQKPRSIEDLDKNLKAAALTEADALTWRPAADKRFTMRGLWWYDENGRGFERLPKRAEGVVRPPVWDLARCSAGARLCFRTDATRMAIRLRNASPDGMMHMPATGQGGCLLYGGEPYRSHPWATAIPARGEPGYERELFRGMAPAMREFTLYLPLYNRPEALDIGLSRGARVTPPSPSALPRPVVFYGTSITQGGCAAVPGSDFVSAVGRRLNLDVINLGFSGNGKGEPEMAQFIAEIDASLFVLDYAANCDAKRLRRTLPPFCRTLRAAHPETPILLITSLRNWRMSYSDAACAGAEEKRDIMIQFYAKMRRAGDAAIHLVDGAALLPQNADGAFVDGGHPTTHGFQIMADHLTPMIEYVLRLG